MCGGISHFSHETVRNVYYSARAITPPLSASLCLSLAGSLVTDAWLPFHARGPTKNSVADVFNFIERPAAGMRNRRRGSARALSVSGIVRHLVAFILALDRSTEIRAADEYSSVNARPDRRDSPFVGSAGDQQQEELLFEDLPEGFHDDVDSITLAVGGHHTCALEYRPGVDFGGPVRCWGRNDWGQSTPSDDIFVQVQLRVF